MGSAADGAAVSTSSYGSGNSLTSTAGRNMAKNSEFMKAFGNGTTNTRTIEPAKTEKTVTSSAGLAFPANNEQSFFDFDPFSNGNSPFPNQNPFGTPGAGLSGWTPDTNFRPLSPPDSASPFSKEWNFGFPNMSNPALPNIVTENQGNNNMRAPYGQVTPPDDEHNRELLLDEHVREQRENSNDAAPARKRKRGGNNVNAKTANQTPSKRSRKNGNRKSGAASTRADSSRPEDVRRTKFLERNRVAASKCRQKKKEWTQDLEDRSRQLQKDNNNIRMMIDSLRQEVVFLKGEMLRHGDCDTPHIQKYLKSCANDMSNNATDFVAKRESSSPFDDLTRGQRTVDLDGQSTIDGDAEQPGPTNAEIAGDETALEALLASSIKQDAGETTAAAQVKG